MRGMTIRAIAVVSLCGALAACGGSHHRTSAATNNLVPPTPTGPGAPTPAPPVSDLAMVSGPAAKQIAQTAVAFYRAAWQNRGAEACALFSPTGKAGFMRAAKVSFPQSINQFSTCTEAMAIYNASLVTSVQNLQQDDPQVSGDGLNNVKIGRIQVHGSTATAIGPLNALPVVNPKQLNFVNIGGRWFINGSYSLSKSNLPKILAEAKKGAKKVPPGR